MLEGIKTAYYGILNMIFGPITSLQPVFAITIFSIFIIFVVTLIYKYTMNQSEVKDIKEKIKHSQEEMKRLQKENPEKVKEAMAEMMKLSNKQMRMSFKPMIPTLLFVLLLLPWMATVFVGPVVKVPFYWPLSGSNNFGWLMWYVILSMPMTQLFRKIMGVEL